MRTDANATALTAVELARLGVLVFACALLYHDVIARLVAAWSADPNYSHGFLIAPLCGYMIWNRRRELASGRGSLWGLLGMLASFGVLVAGELGAELFLTRVSLVAMLASLTLLLCGRRGVWTVALPVLLLLLTIPVPAIIFNQVAFPLQLLASRAGETALQMLHIPVLREGNIIVLSNITLEVAEACSGIRSLMSLLSLGIVYGYFTHESVPVRAALVAASIPIAIVANAARVAGTGVAAQFYGSAAAEGFLHTVSGWLMFVGAFGMLMALDAVVLRRLDTKPAVALLREEVVV
jgi:exosortase